MTDSTSTPPPASTPAPAEGPKYNVLAIVSLITSILTLSIVGIITGHIALSQIKKRGEAGKTLALVGVILGYLGSLGWIIFWLLGGALLFAAANYGSSYLP